MRRLRLVTLGTSLAIVRLDAAAPVPDWAWSGELCAVTRSADELSIVCDDAAAPPGVEAQRGWRALRVAGTLDFSLTGVLAALAAPLARAGVPIFTLSTHDTDYVLVRSEDLERAGRALVEAGHVVARG